MCLFIFIKSHPADGCFGRLKCYTYRLHPDAIGSHPPAERSFTTLLLAFESSEYMHGIFHAYTLPASTEYQEIVEIILLQGYGGIYPQGLYKIWGFRHLPSSAKGYRISYRFLFIVYHRILLVNSADYGSHVQRSAQRLGKERLKNSH